MEKMKKEHMTELKKVEKKISELEHRNSLKIKELESENKRLARDYLTKENNLNR